LYNNVKNLVFGEISSILYQSMADVFADLSKPERIEKATAACAADNRLTVRKILGSCVIYH
jgi:hypothetical protein